MYQPHHEKLHKTRMIRESYVIFGLTLIFIVICMFVYYGRVLYDDSKTQAVLAGTDASSLRLKLVTDQAELTEEREKVSEAMNLLDSAQQEERTLGEQVDTLKRERDAILALKTKEANAAPRARRNFHRERIYGPMFPPDPHYGTAEQLRDAGN